MKLFQTEISPGINSYLSLIERDDAFFKAPYHFHPEMELVYVTESFGKRVIGEENKKSFSNYFFTAMI